VPPISPLYIRIISTKNSNENLCWPDFFKLWADLEVDETTKSRVQDTRMWALMGWNSFYWPVLMWPNQSRWASRIIFFNGSGWRSIMCPGLHNLSNTYFFFLCLLLHLISTKPSLLNLKNSLHSTAEFIHDQSSVSTTHDNIASSFPWTSYGDVTQVEKKENAVTCGNQKSLKLIH